MSQANKDIDKIKQYLAPGGEFSEGDRQLISQFVDELVKLYGKPVKRYSEKHPLAKLAGSPRRPTSGLMEVAGSSAVFDHAVLLENAIITASYCSDMSTLLRHVESTNNRQGTDIKTHEVMFPIYRSSTHPMVVCVQTEKTA